MLTTIIILATQTTIVLQYIYCAYALKTQHFWVQLADQPGRRWEAGKLYFRDR